MAKDNTISTNQMLASFKRQVKVCGGTNEAAEYFDVTPSFIRNVRDGIALPGSKILKLLGLGPVKKILYRYKSIKGRG